MHKIIEDFFKDSDQHFKKMGYKYERIIGLYVFSRRLSNLNNEKFQILIKLNSNNRFDTNEQDEWNEL